jgi:excisionase family DNA binding protein
MMEEQFLTVEDVAQRLKVTPESVRAWLRSGRLRGFRLEARKQGWRVRESELSNFIARAEGRASK